MGACSIKTSTLPTSCGTRVSAQKDSAIASKDWITCNEPGVYTLAGYAAGVRAPGRSSYRDRNAEGDSSTEPFIVGHTELVSHGYVCDPYKKEFQPVQKGTMVITLHGNWSGPWNENVGRPQGRRRCAAQERVRDRLVCRSSLQQGPGRLPGLHACSAGREAAEFH